VIAELKEAQSKLLRSERAAAAAASAAVSAAASAPLSPSGSSAVYVDEIASLKATVEKQ
jgi:hypothetical protein